MPFPAWERKTPRKESGPRKLAATNDKRANVRWILSELREKSLNIAHSIFEARTDL